ncbi:thioredoxin family protein [Nonomuraea sp. ZG12]|uniref:thioredoxin family protein n=1 Tax=Nonomuraea sp. ZG12 TaxID=3452207 RepID=UPI003F8B6F35
MKLYFWSPSCGPCKAISPKVDAAIAAGDFIRKVDVSTEEGLFLARLFGVTATPAYIPFFNDYEVFVGPEVAEVFR